MFVAKEGPLSAEEQIVLAAGYQFVSTTVLHPRGTKHKGVELDRLQTHHHNSRNTHLIIAGSVDIGKARDEQFKFRRVTYGPGEWVDLPSGIDYRGEAGDQGCVFVEGHTVLSPTTAERFERRRDIKRVPEGTPGAFTTS